MPDDTTLLNELLAEIEAASTKPQPVIDPAANLAAIIADMNAPTQQAALSDDALLVAELENPQHYIPHHVQLAKLEAQLATATRRRERDRIRKREARKYR